MQTFQILIFQKKCVILSVPMLDELSAWMSKCSNGISGRSESGRVLEIRIVGSRGDTRLSGSKFRMALGESVLKSTLFQLSAQDGAFVFVGSGRGHGVGMSQWGAQAMARRGVSYREILERFYPGTKLREWGRHFGDNEEFAGR